MQSILLKILAGMLCLALVVLPFTIAVANGLFGLALVVSVVSGIWWRGVRQLWESGRYWLWAWLAYMLLMIMGLLWSPDIHRGLVIISKQWSWLLIPLFLVLCQEKHWRNWVLWSISIGLTLHLGLAVAQSQGVPLPVAAPGGSSQSDPAGLIGHISFGLLYGIWAAWLLHLGWLRRDVWRYALWLLALGSVVMVFMGQGRSGYLVVMVLSAVMVWKLWLQYLGPKILITGIAIAVLTLFVVVTGPAKDRVQWTMDSLKAFSHGDFQHAEARISMWYVSWQAWKQSPWLGIGTGGFPGVSRDIIAAHPNLNIDGHTSFSVPHNIYIMELTRWGPLGLLVLLAWLGIWIRMGWRVDWQQPHQLLVALSGIGLSVHGLTSQAVEEYHASMYAGIFLAIGLASLSSKVSSTEIKANSSSNNCHG